MCVCVVLGGGGGGGRKRERGGEKGRGKKARGDYDDKIMYFSLI